MSMFCLEALLFVFTTSGEGSRPCLRGAQRHGQRCCVRISKGDADKSGFIGFVSWDFKDFEAYSQRQGKWYR
jgi:hypothetical protein